MCLTFFAVEGRGMTFKETAIRLFRQALAVGTDDITVLSAIYSQLGNAYFYEHDFLHALEFHRWDLSLSRFVYSFLF
ncbi:unnamed protein product [Taenia asiatica]|uniref:TPR_REGION domain-containing protein n=1 Tax=Taenia asiatica TaxID=60517 RepID=A0A0R3W746_TAEAS|nr:unnamed protein product [Taenia asiatica]